MSSPVNRFDEAGFVIPHASVYYQNVKHHFFSCMQDEQCMLSSIVGFLSANWDRGFVSSTAMVEK